jgi:CheY-like chemotaxis protein
MVRGTAKRVLVVGDEPEIGSVLGELLARYGYEVQHATHSAAPSLLAGEPGEQPPHVALLDTGRPARRSVSVLEFIRSTLQSNLPVIVLTADATEEHEAEYRRLGVHRLLWKPASASDLLLAVSEAAD